MELYDLPNLIMTPSFDGIPYLEIFKLFNCTKLEEIHPSFGCLDRVVYLSIVECEGIKKFPSITRLKKLEILSLQASPEVFELSEIQQKSDNLLGEKDISSAVRELSNLNHIRLYFFRKDLRKLNLSWCKLGDEDISSAVWELPNLQELNLTANNFSRLNFSLMRTPRLKLLNVSFCEDLVELSELPSSIAVVKANYCRSLKTFGDISNCKWLWKFWLRGVDNLSPLVGHMLLDSMLKGNAIEDHFICVNFDYEIPKEFVLVGSLFRGNTFRMGLPHDWYNDFSGFLIHVVTDNVRPGIAIIIKEEKPDENTFRMGLPHDLSSDDELDNGRIYTYVGYVSFNSLRPSACLNSTYNVISVSVSRSLSAFGAGERIGVALVPRKSKDDKVKTTKVTTDSSEYWNERDKSGPRFAIKHGSKSSIEILWRPLN